MFLAFWPFPKWLLMFWGNISKKMYKIVFSSEPLNFKIFSWSMPDLPEGTCLKHSNEGRHLLHETSSLLPQLMRTPKKGVALVQLLSVKNKATATSRTRLMLKIDVIAGFSPQIYLPRALTDVSCYWKHWWLSSRLWLLVILFTKNLLLIRIRIPNN